MKAGLFGTVCMAVALSSLLHAVESEAKLRAEFEKAYQAKADHTEAFGLLAGAKEKASVDILARVLSVEKKPEQLLAGYKILCAMDDREAAVSVAAATVFTAEKDETRKAHMAEMMSDMKFKFMPLQALIGYYSNTTHQSAMADDLPSVIAGVQKHQENMEKVYNALTKLSSSSIGFDKNARSSYKKWWEANQAIVGKADQELLKQLKAEDAAAKK